MQRYELENIREILDWTKHKISIEHTTKTVYFDEREIWWASIGRNVGTEENGKHDLFERPVIILKRLSRDQLLAIPITTKIRSGNWYYSFDSYGEPRCALLHQIRVLSSKRLNRKVDILPPVVFAALRKALFSLI
jgi:mRNA interferase MazF